MSGLGDNLGTSIHYILDRSGSMDDIKIETILGFESFLKDQQHLEDTSALTLIQFSDWYEETFNNKLLRDAKPLTEDTFQPYGGTALTDAIVVAVTEAYDLWLDTEEENRPDQMLFVIQTDGDENSSKMYTSEQAQTYIKYLKEVLGWNFLYIGANQDAVKVAQRYGIGSEDVLAYVCTKDGVENMYARMSCKVTAYRTKD